MVPYFRMVTAGLIITIMLKRKSILYGSRYHQGTRFSEISLIREIQGSATVQAMGMGVGLSVLQLRSESHPGLFQVCSILV